jgi:hypothetical protein
MIPADARLPILEVAPRHPRTIELTGPISVPGQAIDPADHRGVRSDSSRTVHSERLPSWLRDRPAPAATELLVAEAMAGTSRLRHANAIPVSLTSCA